MTEFEQKLFIAVAKKIKNDNMSLQALTDKVMAEVRAYCDKHKKEYNQLSDIDKEQLDNPNYVLRAISRFKYTSEQLDSAIEGNLKRIPGNLADESRREDLYYVLANLNFKCIYSDTLLVGGGQKIHLDHIIPVNLGGPTDDWNILPICGSCNSSKSDSHLLDWWEKEHTPQDEYKLVYIFEYMANRLLKSLNAKGVKVVTTLTGDEIRRAIELENKERQQEESKQQTIDLEEDDIDDYEDIEDVEEIKDEKIKRLDAITFLYQMLNHIKLNKQYIISPDNLNQGILDTPSDKDKQRLIDKKFKKLEKLFNSIYKQNKRLTGAKTDIQLLDEQRKMVEYIKSLDVVSYYHISYTYFDELQQMLDQGKTDKEIQEFCYEHDRAFNFTQFYKELMVYKEKFGNLRVPRAYINEKTGYRLGQNVSHIRKGKKKLDKWNSLSEDEKAKTKRPANMVLTEDKYKQLTEAGFIWDAGFNYQEFYNELMMYKEKFGDLLVSRSYINKVTGYKLGRRVNSIREGKKKLDIWNALSEEEKSKTSKPTGYFLTEDKYTQLTAEGFVWDAGFNYQEFYNELMAYKDKFGDMLVPALYINKATGYKLGQDVSHIRQGKKTLDEWNALSKEQKSKTSKPTGYLLTEDKYKQLTSEGFVWDATISFDYQEFYKELIDYKRENGHMMVPQRYINKATSYKLGQTVSNIRKGKKNFKEYQEWLKLTKEERKKVKRPQGQILTEEQYTQLMEEGFVWEVYKKNQVVTEQGLGA